MNDLPSPDECIEILKQVGCSDQVINHCKAVRDIAVKIAKKTNADIKLVKAGALLHDIGRSKTHGIHHAVEGVKIAKKLDFSEELIRIIETHIGAGITAEEAKKLGIPERNYIPTSLEEKIVCLADSLTDDGCKQTVESEVEKALSKGLKEYAIRLVNLYEELSRLCGIDINQL